MSTTDSILGSRDMHWKAGPTAPKDGTTGHSDFYTLYDENTGETQVKGRMLSDPMGILDAYYGKYDKDGNFIPTTHFGTNIPIDTAYQQYFSSDEGRKYTLKQAQIAAKKDLMTNGSTATNNTPVSEEEATKLTKDITNTNNATDTATNPEDSDKDADDKTGEGDTKDIEAGNEDKTGTKKEFRKDLRYPITMSDTQDLLKIDMVEYKPSGLKNAKGQWGGESRSKAGEGERNIIGTVFFLFLVVLKMLIK